MIYIFQLYRLFRSAQAGGYSDRRGRSESAEGVGGEEPGTGAKQAAYAPGEGGTAGRKGGGICILEADCLTIYGVQKYPKSLFVK